MKTSVKDHPKLRRFHGDIRKNKDAEVFWAPASKISVPAPAKYTAGIILCFCDQITRIMRSRMFRLRSESKQEVMLNGARGID